MTVDLRATFLAEVRRRFPDVESLPPKWREDVDVLTPPEPCESCGTTVVAVRDHRGTAVCHFVGITEAGVVQMRVHRPKRCRAMRGAS